MQSLNIFWAREALFLNLQVWVEFEILKIYFIGSGPPVSGQCRFLTARASDCTHIAGHQPGHRLVIALMADSAQAPVTAGRCRCPCQGAPIRHWGEFPPLSFSFLIPRRFCSTSLSAAALLLITSHLRPPLSPTKQRNHTAITPSTCSSNREPKSSSNGTEKNRPGSRRLPLNASVLTALVRAPPTSPPCIGGSHESVVQPWQHLCRQQRPVRVAVELSSNVEFLAMAPPLRWAPHRQTTLHRPPLVQDSSPATPCPTSSPVVAGISRWAIGGERGEEAPVSDLGRGTMPFSFSNWFIQFKFPIWIQTYKIHRNLIKCKKL
jgi:hypothetical protein